MYLLSTTSKGKIIKHEVGTTEFITGLFFPLFDSDRRKCQFLIRYFATSCVLCLRSRCNDVPTYVKSELNLFTGFSAYTDLQKKCNTRNPLY